MRIRFRPGQCDATSWISWLTFSLPPPWRYTAFCSAKWKPEKGANWKVILFTLCRNNKKVASVNKKFFCSSLLETELFIVLTAHHCGLGFNRYDNLSVSRIGGVLLWYIKYLCNLFFLSFFLSVFFFFFLSTKSQHDCILQWKITTIQKCAWLHYGCIFEDSKLYLQHKGRLNKWLSIFVPLSPHFMAAFSIWCKSRYTCEISHFCSLFYITVMHLHWNIILWLISIWNCF